MCGTAAGFEQGDREWIGLPDDVTLRSDPNQRLSPLCVEGLFGQARDNRQIDPPALDGGYELARNSQMSSTVTSGCSAAKRARTGGRNCAT